MINLETRLSGSRTNSKDGPTVLIVGDTYVASTIGRALADVADVRIVTDERCVATHADGLSVCLVTGAATDETDVERSGDTSVHSGTLPEADALRAAGAADADVAVVAMKRDAGSLLATQLLRTQFDTTDVVTVVEDPRSVETFADVAPETVCVADLVASTVEATLDEQFSVTQYA